MFLTRPQAEPRGSQSCRRLLRTGRWMRNAGDSCSNRRGSCTMPSSRLRRRWVYITIVSLWWGLRPAVLCLGNDTTWNNCVTLIFTTLHYTTLHYITLHYITLHYSDYAILHFTAPHYTTSHHTTPHHITLHRITLHHITQHHITLQHITLHHITLHHITLHHITLH